MVYLTCIPRTTKIALLNDDSAPRGFLFPPVPRGCSFRDSEQNQHPSDPQAFHFAVGTHPGTASSLLVVPPTLCPVRTHSPNYCLCFPSLGKNEKIHSFDFPKSSKEMHMPSALPLSCPLPIPGGSGFPSSPSSCLPSTIVLDFCLPCLGTSSRVRGYTRVYSAQWSPKLSWIWVSVWSVNLQQCNFFLTGDHQLWVLPVPSLYSHRPAMVMLNSQLTKASRALTLWSSSSHGASL